MPPSAKFGNPYPEGGAFHELLSWHRENGTRPDGDPKRRGKRWSIKELAYASGRGERAVRYWLTGKSLTYDDAPLDRVIFGDNGLYDEWRHEFLAAYDRAQKKTARAVATSHHDHNPGLALQERHVSILVFSQHKVYYNNKIKAVAISPGVEQYDIRYLWAGDGRVEIKCPDPNVTVAQPRRSGLVSKVVKLLLSKRYAKGDLIDIEYTIQACSENQPDEPYFSLRPHESTPRSCKFSITAWFDPDAAVESVWTQEHFPSDNDMPIKQTPPQVVPEDRKFSISLDWKHGHKYCLCWQFADQPKA